MGRRHGPPRIRMIYANNAGTSWPKPREVLRAVAAALEASPAEVGALIESARLETCRFLGIESPGRFLFTPGCTSALAVALSDLPWRDGDVVLTSSLEHHALTRAVEQLKTSRGVTHVAAPYRPGRPIDLDFVSDALSRGGVRLVAVTAASNVTGELLPIADIARLAHAHDSLCLVDAAQTVGIVPVDVGEIEADLWVFAGHKGPQGPQGIGGLWAAPHVGFESPRAVCELRSGGAASAAGSPFPGYCDVGSVNLAGAAGLAAGFRWLASQGYEQTGGKACRLARRLINALQERPFCTLYGDALGDRTATVSLALDGVELDRAEERFQKCGVIVRAGQHCAPMALEAIGADGTLRMSFGPLNDEGDPDRVVAAIDAVLAGA